MSGGPGSGGDWSELRATRKRALITGITGQDGSYLAEYLLSLGYVVKGVSRRTSLPNDGRIRHLADNPMFSVVQGDVTDAMFIDRTIQRFVPDEVYNLAAQSFVGTSFEEPSHAFDVNLKGCLNCLESIRGMDPTLRARFYQASTSEMFGASRSSKGCLGHKIGEWVTTFYQDESTPMQPCSPYAIAKLAAHNLARLYRDAYGLHASSGILFNHESERRGEQFVTRKITKYLAAEFTGEQKNTMLKLGNLDAKRDWGHAEDYVRAMHLMLQQEKPDDYVIATGETHSVRDFVEAAFACVTTDDWQAYVELDPSLHRPCEVPMLLGDASKARRILKWEPRVTFQQLVQRMVDRDFELMEKR